MIESSFRFRRPYKMKNSEKPSNNQPQGAYAWTQGQGTATDLSYDSCPRISELAASTIDDFESLTLDQTSQKNIFIKWDTSSNTYEAELAAIHRLTGDCQLESRHVSHKCKAAFEIILDFKVSSKALGSYDAFALFGPATDSGMLVGYKNLNEYRLLELQILLDSNTTVIYFGLLVSHSIV
ncbi:hypothetical protein ACKLNR_010773 [Fusarium oxysporum f. sp. zingiberi]